MRRVHAILIDSTGVIEMEIPLRDGAARVELEDGRSFYAERETVVFRHLPTPKAFEGIAGLERPPEWR